MNIRDDLTIRAPTGKEDVCVRFRIDTTDEAFILHDIAEGGQQYTLSFYAKSEGAGSITAGNTAMTTSSSWQRYVVTFTADSANIPIYFTVAGTYYLYNTQLEIGCKDTDFALNPADTEIGLSDLTVVVNNHATQFIVMDARISALIAEDVTIRGEYDTLLSRTTAVEASLDGITSRVSLAETDLSDVGTRMTTAESTLNQQVEAISLKVSKGDVISTINQSAEEVKINATKITLEGATIADSFTATNLHVTGNSVFDGTLNGATGSFTGDITATSITAKNEYYIHDSSGAGTKARALYAADGFIGNTLMVGDGFSTLYLDGLIVNQNVGQVLCGDDMTWAFLAGDITANGNLTGTKLYAGSIELTNSTPFIDFHFDNDPSGGDYTARIVETASGRLVIRDRLAIGYVNDDYKLSVASMVCNGWLRTTGSRGWLSEDYGGWYMMDSEWIRAYNGVGIYTAGDIKCGTDLTVAGTASMQGSMTVTGDATVKGTLSFMDYSGTSRRPASSAMTDGKKVAYIASNVNTSGTYYLTVSGQYGTEGSTYTTKNFTATTSDVRLKANIIDTQVEALPLISQIPIREFDWAGTGVHQKIGFVADELELLDEGLAIGGGYDEEGNLNAKGVNEFYLLGYLTKGIQELHDGLLNGEDVLETHDAMIKYLLDENAALKKRVKELEQQAA